MALVFRSAKDLKDRLPHVLRDARRADVVITLRGTPTAILRRFSPDELEGMMLLQSPAVRRRIKRSLDQARKGQTVDLDVLMDELGAPPR